MGNGGSKAGNAVQVEDVVKSHMTTSEVATVTRWWSSHDAHADGKPQQQPQPQPRDSGGSGDVDRWANRLSPLLPHAIATKVIAYATTLHVNARKPTTTPSSSSVADVVSLAQFALAIAHLCKSHRVDTFRLYWVLMFAQKGTSPPEQQQRRNALLSRNDVELMCRCAAELCIRVRHMVVNGIPLDKHEDILTDEEMTYCDSVATFLWIHTEKPQPHQQQGEADCVLAEQFVATLTRYAPHMGSELPLALQHTFLGDVVMSRFHAPSTQQDVDDTGEGKGDVDDAADGDVNKGDGGDGGDDVVVGEADGTHPSCAKSPSPACDAFHVHCSALCRIHQWALGIACARPSTSPEQCYVVSLDAERPLDNCAMYPVFPHWDVLYSSATHGRSGNQWESHLLHYEAPTAVVVRTSEKAIFATYCPHEWINSGKGFYGAEQGSHRVSYVGDFFLIGLSPRFRVLKPTGVSKNFMYYFRPKKSGYRRGDQNDPGIGFGGQIGYWRVFIDEDLDSGVFRSRCSTYECCNLADVSAAEGVDGEGEHQGCDETRFTIDGIHVIGMGGHAALREQQVAQRRHLKSAMNARQVNRKMFAGNDDADMTLLEMGGAHKSYVKDADHV